MHSSMSERPRLLIGSVSSPELKNIPWLHLGITSLGGYIYYYIGTSTTQRLWYVYRLDVEVFFCLSYYTTCFL